jgi:protein gp37
MAETTKIEWADATVSMWWGCTRVSEACRNCYAESWANRWGKKLWGPGAPRERKKGAEALARKLNRQAEREGRRLRVFSASMSDWLDDEVPAEWLADLLGLVAETPHLDWLLLSKRPHLWRERLDAALDACGLASQCRCQERCFCDARTVARLWIDGEAPANVWVGATVEDQERADERVPALLAIPARVRFLSMEPLLGPVDLGRWIGTHDCHPCGARFWPCCDFGGRYGLVEQGHDEEDQERADEEEGSTRAKCPRCGHPDLGTGDVGVRDADPESDGLHWIITGGESGRNARPSHPDWFRSLRDQAQAAGVAFHFKQWGEHAPIDGRPEEDDPAVDIYPSGVTPDGRISTFTHMRRVGKARAGRELDGREWNELPEVARG